MGLSEKCVVVLLEISESIELAVEFTYLAPVNKVGLGGESETAVPAVVGGSVLVVIELVGELVAFIVLLVAPINVTHGTGRVHCHVRWLPGLFTGPFGGSPLVCHLEFSMQRSLSVVEKPSSRLGESPIEGGALLVLISIRRVSPLSGLSCEPSGPSFGRISRHQYTLLSVGGG